MAIGLKTNPSKMIETISSMFNYRDVAEEKKKDMKMKKQAALLVVTLPSGLGNPGKEKMCQVSNQPPKVHRPLS